MTNEIDDRLKNKRLEAAINASMNTIKRVADAAAGRDNDQDLTAQQNKERSIKLIALQTSLIFDRLNSCEPGSYEYTIYRKALTAIGEIGAYMLRPEDGN